MQEKEKKITFNKILLFINIFFSLYLLIIYFSIESDPVKYGYFSLLGLLYLPILVINLIFIIYWLIVKNSYFLLSTIIILIGYNHIPKNVQFFGNKQDDLENHINILSFNTRKLINNGWEKKNIELRYYTN